MFATYWKVGENFIVANLIDSHYSGGLPLGPLPSR
jgi:hypothetical protein